MAEGDIGSVLDSLEFDTADCAYPNIIHIAGDVYAVSYTGPGSDGWLVTFTINAAGAISDGIIDSLEFDTAQGLYPRIVHVSGNVSLLAYSDANGYGVLATVKIEPDGKIDKTFLNKRGLGNLPFSTPDLFHVSGNVFAIAHQGLDGDGFVTSRHVANDGTIGENALDTLEFDTDNGAAPCVIRRGGNIYAVAYAGTNSRGTVATVTIHPDGMIDDAVIDTLIFDNFKGLNPRIIHISGNVYAIAYTGKDDDGFVTTIGINANGTIDDAVIDTWEFDTVNCLYPDILHVSGLVYAVAYDDIGLKKQLKTVVINDNGAIPETVIDTLQVSLGYCSYTDMIHVSGNIYAITHQGPDGDGFVRSFDIETKIPAFSQYLPLMGIG